MRQHKFIATVLGVSAAVLLSGAMLTATGADAARGGGGKGGNGGGKPTPTAQPSTATVTLISQNPVPVGTAPTFYATGYAPGVLVYLVMSGYIVADGMYADASGSVTYTFREPMWAPGGYTFSTMERNGVNKASVSFTVQ